MTKKPKRVDLMARLHPFIDPAIGEQIVCFLRRPAPVFRPVAGLRAPRLTGSDIEALSRWTLEGFSVDEKDQWIAHGLGRYDAVRARQCCQYGISPESLATVLDGERAGNRIRGGESVPSVAARFDILRQRGETFAEGWG